MNAATAEAMTLPAVFHADGRYRLTLAAFTALGVLGSGYVSRHQPTVGIVCWAMTGLYLLLLALMLSLRVQIDADGLLQRWLFSGVRVPWGEVARLDRTRRGYALFNRADREQILLIFLPLAAQQAIARQTIQRARLRPVAVEAGTPVPERWERPK